MIRLSSIFLLAALFGLFTDATVIHLTFPTMPSPDILLILTVILSLFFHNAGGVTAAFLLGLLGDFASGRYLGPNAAGCVIAFCLLGLITKRVYADNMLAVSVITAVCSVSKSLTFVVMMSMFVPGHLMLEDTGAVIVREALCSAIVAPFILAVIRGRALSLSFRRPRPRALRWSA